MARELDMKVLEGAARAYAVHFRMPSEFSRKRPKVAIRGRDWVLQSMFNGHFKDEFDAIFELMRDEFGRKALAEFDAAAGKLFTPRDPAVFAAELENRLAITPNGDHIEGKIGKVVVDTRVIGTRIQVVPTSKGPVPVLVPAVWNIYAGENDERDRPGGGVADPIPDDVFPGNSVGALSATYSAAFAIASLDAGAALLNGGSGPAVIQIRSDSAAQPADPDAAQTGVLLATHVMSDPAYLGATDQSPGAQALADSIADDASIDATGTADHYRQSSTNDGATPLNGVMDGSVGAGTFNLNVNTDAFVSGATSSITSAALTQAQS